MPILLNQQHQEFEIIIVNDRSNDGTFDFLLEETKKQPRLKMVNIDSTPAHVNGKKYGITLGIKAAKYDWILFTDADCRPNTDQWIRTVSERTAEDKNFLLGYSGYEKRPGFLNLFIRFETLFTAIQYIGAGAKRWEKKIFLASRTTDETTTYKIEIFLPQNQKSN